MTSLTKARTLRLLSFSVMAFCLGCNTLLAQHRLITIGDAIEIVVYGEDGLNKTVVVGKDGTVEYPGLEDIPVDGLDLQRFREIIVAQLTRYMDHAPFVTARFSDTYPIKVTVLGHVGRPGPVILRNTATIQNALFEAGGLTQGAVISQIKIVRDDGQRRKAIAVNMEKFYLEGDFSYLPALHDGDRVVVPGNPATRTVKVLGAVVRPGSYDVSLGMSLLDVIFMAGGPTNDANLKKIKLVSMAQHNVRNVGVDMNSLADAGHVGKVPLAVPGDVILVPSHPVTWGKFLGFFRDMTILATLAVIVFR